MDPLDKCACFPSLSKLEFGSAAQHIVQLHAAKGGSQSPWMRVEVNGPPDATLLCIEREVNNVPRRCTDGVDEDEDSCHQEIYEDDEDVLVCAKIDNVTRIIYSITLSETYQVPILHFSIQRNGKNVWPPIEEIHQIVVSATYSRQLHQSGVMGAITMTNHPITSTPCFFVHPCRTAEALTLAAPRESLNPFEYMQLWFGIIGTATGLSMPIELLRTRGQENHEEIQPAAQSSGFP